jgi:hypothetical protein
VFTPVILATQEAEIRRIKVQSKSRKVVLEILSQKQNKTTQNPSHKRACGVTQGVCPEFKLQYHTHIERIIELVE